MKKTIVHVIDSLGRGGAETMLLALLPDLNKEYNIVLVTLSDTNDFEAGQAECFQRYSLNCTGKAGYIKAVFELKKIIQKHKPDLVRTQLYWSTIVGRLATPKTTPFVFSVHSKLSADAFSSRWMYWLEKLTYKSRHTLVAVSQAVLNDYQHTIGIKGKTFVLNNFVQQVFFEKSYTFNPWVEKPFRMIAVGNLKRVKNHQFLLNVMALIKGKANIQLDIIGDGVLKNELSRFISRHDLPVNLLGKRSDVAAILPAYDAYIMCSLHEGFGNAPVEAMAIGLPLILNDSDTMKEVSKENALFFESGNEESLKELLLNLATQTAELGRLSHQGKIISAEHYQKDSYLKKLAAIYGQL